MSIITYLKSNVLLDLKVPCVAVYSLSEIYILVSDHCEWLCLSQIRHAILSHSHEVCSFSLLTQSHPVFVCLFMCLFLHSAAVVFDNNT